MKPLPRWIAFASFPAVLALKMTATYAFTDTNAELKAAASDPPARPAPPAQANGPVPPPVPARTAWVPPSPKSLDGFRPVLPKAPPAHAPDPQTRLARAQSPASTAQR